MKDGEPGSNDPFRPPAIPTEVHCLHCNEEYESYLIKWVPHDEKNSEEGFWCCPTPGCDGKGFGFDIFPTDPDWIDENGERMWWDDDEDYEDEEVDELEAEDEAADYEASEDDEFEWTPEWEQSVYGDHDQEEEDRPKPDDSAGGNGKKPPDIPFNEDDIPF